MTAAHRLPGGLFEVQRRRDWWRTLGGIASDELEDRRLLGGQLRRGGHIALRPEAPWTALRDAIRRAHATLDRGDSVVVFPQGSILGIEITFKPGAFTLARALGHPVLPVVLAGTHRVWEHPFSPRLRFGQTIALRVLPSMPAIDAYARRHQLEATMKRIALEGPVPPRRFDPRRDGHCEGYRYEIDESFPDVARLVEAHRARRATGGSDASSPVAARA